MKRHYPVVKDPYAKRQRPDDVKIDLDGDGVADLAVVPLNPVGEVGIMEVDGDQVGPGLPDSSKFPRGLKTSSFSGMSRRQFAPVAATTSYRQGPGRTGLTIRGRDYIGDIGHQTAFTTKVNKVINPADTGVFRWFGQLATLFETYKFTQLSLVFEPQCPSSTSGALIIYFDPDPTNTADPADWAAASQIGVNVHGAAWAKHTLNVPLSLCASRREYYIRKNFPAINVVGDFSYDPYEFFCGRVGVATSGSTADITSVGKLYIDYTCMLGKANDSSESTTTVAGTIASTPIGQESKSVLVQRTLTTTISPANFILLGPQATETVANNGQATYGFSLLRSIQNTTELAAPQDLQLKVIVTVSSNAGTWANNCVEIGLYNGATSAYQYSPATTEQVVSEGKCKRLYDAGVGTTAYMAMWDVFLKTNQRFAIRTSAAPGATAWWNQAPGYTIRIVSATYGV